MNREDAKDTKEEERRIRELGEQVEQLAYYRVIGAAIDRTSLSHFNASSSSYFALFASLRFVKRKLPPQGVLPSAESIDVYRIGAFGLAK
jgi:hypothetical protein